MGNGLVGRGGELRAVGLQRRGLEGVDLGGALLEQEGVAEDEQVGEEGFEQLEAGLLRVGALQQALQRVAGLRAAVGVADDELVLGGGGGNFADAGVDDFVAVEALQGELVEVGGGVLLHPHLPGRDEGQGAFEAEVLDGLGGEGEGTRVEEGHPNSGRRRGRVPGPGAGASRGSSVMGAEYAIRVCMSSKHDTEGE